MKTVYLCSQFDTIQKFFSRLVSFLTLFSLTATTADRLIWPRLPSPRPRRLPTPPSQRAAKSPPKRMAPRPKARHLIFTLLFFSLYASFHLSFSHATWYLASIIFFPHEISPNLLTLSTSSAKWSHSIFSRNQRQSHLSERPLRPPPHLKTTR